MVKYSAIYFLLILTQVIHGQNTVCFDIEENPNANSTAFGNFTKYVRVLDCFSIYAESSISDAKVLHAAAVAAELLDNDEDGYVDDPLLKAELASNEALMPRVWSEKPMHFILVFFLNNLNCLKFISSKGVG